ncbi:MAG: hypothetical protein N2383_00635 [Caldilineales bacterium]|nr:hypothetical protein [Caldilineales bacterium]
MAKPTPAPRKRRRQRRPNVPPYTGPIQPTAPEATAGDEDRLQTGLRKSQVAASGAVGGAVDFASEYRYVIRDLRNMFIVAGAMLVLLLVLNFVLAR